MSTVIIKLSDHQRSVSQLRWLIVSRHQLFWSSRNRAVAHQHCSNLQCVSYPPSLTVLLGSSSYNLGDNLGSLPSTHNPSFGGTVVCWGISISYLDLACCFTTTMQTLPSAVHYNNIMVWYQHFYSPARFIENIYSLILPNPPTYFVLSLLS